ncbi:hypothetical protein Tco_0460453, partial [Tanacetum coccineum]
HADKDTYSASAEDIEVQSCFLNDQLTNLSPPRSCMPPDVLLRESRQPALSESKKAVSSRPVSFGYQRPKFETGVLRIPETHVNGVFKVPKDPFNR